MSSSIPKPPAICPVCQAELLVGVFSIHGTFLSFFFVGMSYEHLWFKEHGQREHRMMASYEKLDGVRCAKCGFMGIFGKKN